MNGSDGLDDGLVMDLVVAFKAARARGDAVDLNEFVPQRDHPLYKHGRRELLLVDLELAWQAGRRRLLLDYVSIFPDLLDDRITIEALAFAEYRRRLLAGEDPSPAEYEWQYGLLASDWPSRAREAICFLNAPAAGGEPKTEIVPTPEPDLTRIVTPVPGDVENDGVLDPEFQVSSRLNQAINALPAVGTQFLSFQLIAELGRGGFGRVYLARQGDLASRLVALKITVDLHGEEQKLAQLQHTNVVPVYSYHHDGDLHAVCMPYFGATTLADVIRVLQIHAKLPGSGRSLVDTVRTRRSTFLDKAVSEASRQNPVPECPVPRNPHSLGAADLAEEDEASVTLTLLEEATYVDAVLWIAERLAEGLSHAHEHGILHRDLKPANILLTDDGQPMLLDFNLSADTKLGAGLKERRVGGTLPYMAPEHLASLAGRISQVDERCDVYAIGVILYELLTGRLPFAAMPGPLSTAIPAMITERMKAPPLLRPWNPAISFGVESIVRHCLEGDADRRYQSARHLREDLKRQRQHRPLQYAAEPSIAERLRKWGRRHPRLLSPASLGAVTAVVLMLALAPLTWQTWKQWERQNLERDEALVKSREDIESAKMNTRQRDAAIRKQREFRDSLGSARAVMESVNAIQVLPKFMKAWACEEVNLQANTAKCRDSLGHYEVLTRPDWQDQPMVKHLPAAERQQLRRDVVELLFVLAQAEQVRATHLRDEARLHEPVVASLVSLGVGMEVWSAWQANVQVPLRVAMDLNERARQSCGGDVIPRAVLIQHAELAQASGDTNNAKHLWTVAESAPLCAGTQDAYWTASALAAKGDFKGALPLLSQAVAEAPEHYGAWLLRGLCLTPRFSVASLHNDQTDRQQALECFTTCIVMRPRGWWAYYNRGLVSYHLNLSQNAIADFDRILQAEVLKKQPAFATALVPRATALLGIAKYDAAESDLSSAITLEPDVPEYYFLRAGIRDKLKKHADARLDEQRVLQSTPATAEGWTYRGMVRIAKDPTGALTDFDKALAIDPDEPLTLFVKGRLLTQVLKRHKDAIAALDKALAIKPDYIEARTTRGLAHAALGERTLAHKDADAVLESEPSPHMHYQVARIYALTSRRHPADARYALGLLAFALRYGYGVQSYRQEPDLAPLQSMPEFERLGIGLKYLGVPQ